MCKEEEKQTEIDSYWERDRPNINLRQDFASGEFVYEANSLDERTRIKA